MENNSEDKKDYTIEKTRPKKNKKKIEENMKDNPMYFVFGEKILTINKNKI
tara:strand:- start:1155 stop:1307 length:153 start_codon:yes stop_codon:yes gene_type:complete